MERKYYCNMFVINNHIVDTEHAEWHIVGLTDKNPEKYIKIKEDSFKVSKVGCYLEHIGPMNIDTNKFTLSFTYKLHQGFFQRLNFDPTDIYALGWNTGDIKIFDYDTQGNFIIRIIINENDIQIPINYIDYYYWNNLLLAYDNGRLQIFQNGVKKKEDIYNNITCTFDYLKVGNYKQQSFEHEGPIVEYNNIVLVNDCLYNEDFDWKKHYLHLLFPEAIYNPKESKSSETLVAAPYLYSSKNSYNDILNNNQEVTRRKDYKPDRQFQYLKYKFE